MNTSSAITFNKRFANEHQVLRALGWWPFEGLPGTAEEADSIAAWQTAQGVPVDGKAGVGTWARLRALFAPRPWLRKIPRGYPELRQALGDPKERDGQGGRLIVDSTWEHLQIGRFPLHTGRTVTLNVDIAQEFVVLFELACRLSGYTPLSVQTYVPRRKMWKASNNPSIHTWGAAFDVDPSLNGYGKTSGTRVREHPMFPAVFRAAGWSCGMDWSTPDDMHFQAVTNC